MYCLRRAAFRAISTPTTSFFLKPRSIATVTPSALRTARQIPNLAFQQRWFSDEVRKDEEAESRSEKETSSAGIYDGSSLFSESERSSPASTGSDGSSVRINRPRAGVERPERFFEPNETVYIGNLFFDVTAEDLSSEFQRFGTVISTKIVYDQRGLSRGFAYVTFDTKEASKNAIDAMNRQVFEGRRLTVNFAAPRIVKEERPMPMHSPSKTLFIGNMSFEMTDTDLNALFRDIRNVVDVRVAVDRRTGTPRGFAHADFVDVESAMEAMEKLKGKSPYGRKLKLDYGMTRKGMAGGQGNAPGNERGSGSGSGSGSESSGPWD